MRRVIGAALAAMLAAGAFAAPPAPLPRIETNGGRHAFLVDGRPFLMLGAQTNNSSNYPSQLPKVWPMLDRLHANTVEIPVAWEQVEPEEGRFDFGFVQTLLDQARAHGKRVVILWFGTWKNTNPQYAPAWVKLDNRRFPRMKKRDGSDGSVLSPHARSTLEADKRAFVRLMTYLRDRDPQNTVIMVQVENEVGSYGNPRDHGAAGEAAFRGQVPEPLLRALKRRPGTWDEVFGPQAERTFATWSFGRYVDEIAAAGKAIKPLPMYVNAANAPAFGTADPMRVSSGGPQHDVLDIWKAATPSIELAATDIYNRDPAAATAYLDGFARPDNALFVPEIGNAAEFARFFWSALGRGAIGFAPFGMDETGYFNFPLGAKALDDATVAAFADKYALFAPMARDWAALAAAHPTWGVAKGADAAPQSTTLGDWTITAHYGQWQMRATNPTALVAERPSWTADPVGGCVVLQLAPDQFLVAGDHVRVMIEPRAGTEAGATIVRIEEGRLENGRWTSDRVWNGDQADFGLNFIDKPLMLRVTMGHYR